MRRTFSLILLFFLSAFVLISQDISLDYYLPEATYDASVPTPASVFGHEIGEWHLSHDKLLVYYEKLAAASEKITLHEYGRSHENRPLIYLLITSEENHKNIESIQAEHLALCDPVASAKLDVSTMPLVVYQGFTIHGNESSGANGAPLVAYRLAAAQDEEVQELLENTVIIFDPCFNPDGFQRFSTWANMHKNQNLTAENVDREYREAWPRGRTNHYWFDLNRDWLPGQQPESVGRIENFQNWRPNILTDHHEMGTSSTFFFMPGIQSRINPETPKENQELTFKIGAFHAKALDEIGALYYTEESYDDFYYGKGSTFPDAQGCIGILFEQASSRGHLQNTENGELSFPFTIRNQVKTALSTQTAGLALREELLNFQRDFYQNAFEEARQDSRKAFIVGEQYDAARLVKFAEMLQRQKVDLFELKQDISIGNTAYKKGKAYIIPLAQPQYTLIKGMFQRITEFSDSIFYDVSAWTLPLAFNLEYDEMGSSFSKNILGEKVGPVKLPEGKVNGTPRDYAFAFEWDGYYAPAALYYLQKNDILLKVASKPFSGKTSDGERSFNYGTIIIPTQNQPKSGVGLLTVLRKAAELGRIDIYGLSTGLTSTGIDLGSRNMEALQMPRIALMVGDGVNSYDAGEIWHLLDTRYQVPIAKVDANRINSALLDRFNVVIMPSGNYSGLDTEMMRNWIRSGGTLIACENAINWLEGRKLARVEFKQAPKDRRIKGRGTYIQATEDRAALNLSGAIFESSLDLSHPMAYGYRRSELPIFRSSNRFMQPAKNVYATPLAYSENPLMAGYMHENFDGIAPQSASIIVGGQGSGKVILLQDNVNFRAFWYGTNKLLANAIFFGKTISYNAVER
ncbi:MAG: M14 family zinc carboxypeptidase [Bacteroidota bacterium]